MHTKSLILTKCNTCSSRSTLVLSRETILSYFSLEITFALFFFKRNSMWFSNAILCLALQSDPRRIVCGVWRTILEWTGFILELAANVGILKMGSPFQNRADSKNAQNIYIYVCGCVGVLYGPSKCCASKQRKVNLCTLTSVLVF